MAFRTGLAKVAGAVRYSGWGERLEGKACAEVLSASTPSLLTTLANLQNLIAPSNRTSRHARPLRRKSA